MRFPDASGTMTPGGVGSDLGVSSHLRKTVDRKNSTTIVMNLLVDAVLPPFVDREAGTVDIDRILAEAVPIAELVGLFVAIALVPFVLVVLLAGSSPVGMVLAVVMQFVLAVGAGIVLLYTISGGIQLADK